MKPWTLSFAPSPLARLPEATSYLAHQEAFRRRSIAPKALANRSPGQRPGLWIFLDLGTLKEFASAQCQGRPLHRSPVGAFRKLIAGSALRTLSEFTDFAPSLPRALPWAGIDERLRRCADARGLDRDASNILAPSQGRWESLTPR
jgi:hypothetical protein